MLCSRNMLLLSGRELGHTGQKTAGTLCTRMLKTEIEILQYCMHVDQQCSVHYGNRQAIKMIHPKMQSIISNYD